MLGALLLALVAALWLLWPRDTALRAADLDDPNLQWYRQRRAELGDDAESALLEEVQLRLLEEGGAGTADGEVDVRDGRALRWLLLPVLLLLGGLLYARLGAFEDVMIQRAIEGFDAADPAAAAALTARIEARSGARPDNLQYLNLLGQLQMGQEDYVAAARTHARLAELATQDAAAQARAAQSRFLASERVLDEQAQLYAERALALDPTQNTALGLLGMAAFEQGQYNAAIVYWERLLEQEEPGSPGHNMIASIIGVARERQAAAGGGEVAPAAEIAAETTAAEVGLRVTLALPETAAVPPDAAVFVFARRPDAASRMPIAVRRLRAGDLPLTLRLSDSDSMAGQLLSASGAVAVTAQLSGNGQPGEANALYLGRSEPIAADNPAPEVRLELQPVPASE